MFNFTIFKWLTKVLNYVLCPDSAFLSRGKGGAAVEDALLLYLWMVMAGLAESTDPVQRVSQASGPDREGDRRGTKRGCNLEHYSSSHPHL